MEKQELQGICYEDCKSHMLINEQAWWEHHLPLCEKVVLWCEKYSLTKYIVSSTGQGNQ